MCRMRLDHVKSGAIREFNAAGEVFDNLAHLLLAKLGRRVANINVFQRRRRNDWPVSRWQWLIHTVPGQPCRGFATRMAYLHTNAGVADPRMATAPSNFARTTAVSRP